MAGRSANQIFDFDAFREDVKAYTKRFGITLQALADGTELERGTINSFFYSKDSEGGLLTIASIAFFCDLSLDKYIVENPSCENCSTVINRKLVKVWHPVGRPCGTA